MTAHLASPGELPVPRLASYFARYPDPIGLSGAGAHLMLCAGELLGYQELTDIVLHQGVGQEEPVYLASEAAVIPFVSIRFHRGDQDAPLLSSNFAELLQVISKVAPSLTRGEGALGQPAQELAPDTYTVVEMVTPLVVPMGDKFYPASLEQDVMGPNLTRCIEGFRRIVNADRLSQKVPISVPARERLGPVILSGTRPADPSHGGWDGIGKVVVNEYATYRPLSMSPPTSSQAHDEMGMITSMLDAGHPAAAMMELEADAKVALRQNGDFRSALMLLHTASEVMLDGVLMALCWEEGMSSAEAAAEFTSALVPRVRSKYHDRLNGDWSTGGTSPVERWWTHLVLPRHKTAHQGLVLSREDAETALTAFEEMRRHVWN